VHAKQFLSKLTRNRDKADVSMLSIRVLNLLAPLRSPSSEFSNIAFVINLKADVRAPDAAAPPRKDYNNKTIKKSCIC